MERTQIYLSKEQIVKLRDLAHKRKTTLSELVREAVSVRYGKKQEAPRKEQETLLQAAQRINKLGSSGPKDLSTNLDTYLYGDI